MSGKVRSFSVAPAESDETEEDAPDAGKTTRRENFGLCVALFAIMTSVAAVVVIVIYRQSANSQDVVMLSLQSELQDDKASTEARLQEQEKEIQALKSSPVTDTKALEANDTTVSSLKAAIEEERQITKARLDEQEMEIHALRATLEMIQNTTGTLTKSAAKVASTDNLLRSLNESLEEEKEEARSRLDEQRMEIEAMKSNLEIIQAVTENYTKVDANDLIRSLEDALEEEKQQTDARLDEQELVISKLLSNVELFQNTSDTLAEYARRGSSTYIRWGRSTCPGNGTDLVYSGYVGGSNDVKTGSAVNYLCLPTDPQWNEFQDSLTEKGGLLFGGVYKFHSSSIFADLLNRRPLCSMCLACRQVVIMIPGRNTCYPGWTKEYNGYLISGSQKNAASSEFVCLDSEPEAMLDGNVELQGKHVYLVEAQCTRTSLSCPPYEDGREITCVVCSK